MALALYAVFKADQMVHFETEFKALSNGESINPKSSIAANGQRRHQGRRQIGPRVLND